MSVLLFYSQVIRQIQHFLLVSIFLLGGYSKVSAQLWDYTCSFDPNTTVVSPACPGSTVLSSIYGGVFTPREQLRILVIYAGFNNDAGRQHIDGWPDVTGPNELSLPDSVNPITGAMPYLFFQDTSEFRIYANDPNNKSVSKYYYELSMGKFQLLADVYKDATGKPVRVDIDSNGFMNYPTHGWDFLNRRVLDSIKATNPNFDWSPYDQRTNQPLYKCDNSISPPDFKPDYVVIIWRYNPDWDENAQPGINLDSASGSGGGSSVLGGASGFTMGPYTFDHSGFTYSNGATSSPQRLFIHEIAHELFEAPHIFGASGTAGLHFYEPASGYGMCIGDKVFMGGANGWERWMLGWIGLKANGVNSDIESEADLASTSGVYTLRDFIRTGDVIRIKIPFSNQHLWIENHQKLSIFDEKDWVGDHLAPADPTSEVAPVSPGVYMYVEDILGDQSQIYDGMAYAIEKVNGIRMINAAGNYDFSASAAFDTTGYYLVTHTYTCLQPNPLSGFNPLITFRRDIDNNNVLSNINTYNWGINEDLHIAREDISGTPKMLYRSLGGLNSNAPGTYHSEAFAPGDSVDMGTNPAITNYPFFNTSTDKLDVVKLNGLSVKILSQTADSIKVKIEFNKAEVGNDTRWTGYVELPDITGDRRIDVDVKPYKVVTIDKSGIPNKTIKTAASDFINPTVFTCLANSYFYLENNAQLIIDHGSTFIIEAGATLEADNSAKVIVRNGSKLIIKGNGVLYAYDGAEFIIEAGSQLVYESNAGLTLAGNNSLLEFQDQAALIIGSNATFSFSGDGMLRFENTNPSFFNIVGNNFSNFSISGSGRTDKILEVMGGGPLRPASIDLFEIKDGLIEASANSSIKVDIIPLNLFNVYMKNFNSQPMHGGISASWKNQMTVNNCKIEGATTGLKATLLSLGGTTTPSLDLFSTTINDCQTGLYTVGPGAVNIDNSTIRDNSGKNWNSVGPDRTAKFTSSFATNSTTASGMILNHTGTGAVQINQSYITGNGVNGLELYLTQANIRCSQFLNNTQKGIYATNNSIVNSSPDPALETGYNKIYNNLIGIELKGAENLLIDQGQCDFNYNTNASFTGYMQVNPWNAVPRDFYAENNYWGGGAIPPANTMQMIYSTGPGLPLSYSLPIDASPYLTLQPDHLECAQGTTGGGPNTNHIGPHFLINSTNFVNYDLNDAIRQTIALTYAPGFTNHILVIDRLAELLTYNYGVSRASVAVSLDICYNKMLEVAGDGVALGIISVDRSNPTLHSSLQTVQSVQQYLIGELATTFTTPPAYDREFKYKLDHALIWRLGEQRNTALSELYSLISIAYGLNSSLLTFWTCLTEQENIYISSNGEIEIEGGICADALASSTQVYIPIPPVVGGGGDVPELPGGGGSGKKAQVKKVDVPEKGFSFYPNPASTLLNLHFTSQPEHGLQITLVDAVGRTVQTYSISEDKTDVQLSVANLETGVYFIKIVEGEYTYPLTRFVKIR